MRLCKECYAFLQVYIVPGTMIVYDPGGQCEVCQGAGLISMDRLSQTIDVFHLVVDSLDMWKDLIPQDAGN